MDLCSGSSLPVEILNLIYVLLPTKDQCRCLRVCRHWYFTVLPHLYSFSRSYVLSWQPLLRLFKVHRHHIRHVEWRPTQFAHVPQLCELLFDATTPDSSVSAPAATLGEEEDEDMIELLSLLKDIQPRRDIRSMFFEGWIQSIHVVYKVFYWLPALTRLEIVCPVTRKLHVDLQPIFDALPHLQHLSIVRCMVLPWPPVGSSCGTLDKDTWTLPPLKSLLHGVELFETVDAQLLLKCLPGLTELTVDSIGGTFAQVRPIHYNARKYARVLQRSCSRLQKLAFKGWILHHLFLPASTLGSTGDVQMEAVAPELTSFECMGTSVLALEDFRLLPRLRHLVHLDISVTRSSAHLWPRFDGTDSLRTMISSPDLEWFLESFPTLKRFVAVGRSIRFEDLILPDSQGELEEQESISRPRQTRRWACEDSLEVLALGWVFKGANRHDHAAVWNHLGRLHRLKSLQIDKSNLIPSLGHGMGALKGLERLKTFWNSRSQWPYPEKEAIIWLGTEMKALETIVMDRGYNKAEALAYELLSALRSVGKSSMVVEGDMIREC